MLACGRIYTSGILKAQNVVKKNPEMTTLVCTSYDLNLDKNENHKVSCNSLHLQYLKGNKLNFRRVRFRALAMRKTNNYATARTDMHDIFKYVLVILHNPS